MAEFGAVLTSVAEYALLMRVPLITGVVLVLLPVIATRKGFRALLLGLFDVTPASLIALALAATSVAGIVSDNARIIYLHSFARGVGGLTQQPYPVERAVWFALTVTLSLPVIAYAVYYSNKQNPDKGLVRVALGGG